MPVVSGGVGSAVSRLSQGGFHDATDLSFASNPRRRSFSQHILPSSEDLHSHILYTSKVQRLKTDLTWIDRAMTLSAEVLSFSEGGESAKESERVIDYIPLEEIVTVRTCTIAAHDNLLSGEDSYNNSSKSLTSAAKMTLARAKSFTRPTSAKNVQKGTGGSMNAQNTFEVLTKPHGHNGGRTFVVRSEEWPTWMEQIQKHAKARSKVVYNHTRIKTCQRKVRELYNSFWFQSLVALIVVVNFLLNALQAESEPLALTDKSKASRIYEDLDLCFTVFFLIEISINIFAYWFWDFVHDTWSMFDLAIILLSVLSLALENLVNLSILRVFRCIRILRLVKRFDSLRAIMISITHSIVPVLNALLMVLIIHSIFTVFGVYLFSAESAEHFGTFTISMATLFELMAFGIWPSALSPVRYLEETDTHTLDSKSFLFIVLFTALVTWTLLQVVVAVLLDNFMTVTMAEKQTKAWKARMETKTMAAHPIDGLVRPLLSSVDTEKELLGSINTIFKTIDTEDSGTVSSEQLRDGLRRLNLDPPVQLSEEDFATLTHNGALCDEDGCVGALAFQQILVREVHSYTQRHVSDAAAVSGDGGDTAAILQGIRLLLMTQEGQTRDLGTIVRTPSSPEYSPPASSSPTAVRRAVQRARWLEEEGRGGGRGEGCAVERALERFEERVAAQVQVQLAQFREEVQALVQGGAGGSGAGVEGGGGCHRKGDGPDSGLRFKLQSEVGPGPREGKLGGVERGAEHGVEAESIKWVVEGVAEEALPEGGSGAEQRSLRRNSESSQEAASDAKPGPASERSAVNACGPLVVPVPAPGPQPRPLEAPPTTTPRRSNARHLHSQPEPEPSRRPDSLQDGLSTVIAAASRSPSAELEGAPAELRDHDGGGGEGLSEEEEAVIWRAGAGAPADDAGAGVGDADDSDRDGRGPWGPSGSIQRRSWLVAEA